MAITDAQLYFTIGPQTITATNTISENVLDFEAANADPGEGRPLYLNVEVTTLTVDPTVVTLYSDSDASVLDGTAHMSFTIPDATPVGTLYRYPVPIGVNGRYVGLGIDGGASAAGAVKVWLDLG